MAPLHVRRILFAMLLVCAMARQAAAGDLGQSGMESSRDSISVSLDREATLFLHMECLAGELSCSRDAYEQFWRANVGEPAYSGMVGAWREIMSRYDIDIPLADKGIGPEFPDIGPPPGFDLRWKIQRMMMLPLPPAERREILRTLMRLNDANALFELMDRHRSAFDQWWEQNEARWQEQRDQIDAAIAGRTAELISAMFAFFGVENSKLSIALLPRPGQSGNYKGFQNEDAAILEIGREQDSNARIGVVAHELSHRLMRRAVDFNKTRYKAAAHLRTRGTGVATGLSGEVIATVIGNGIAEKLLQTDSDFAEYLKRPNSFYNNEAIDISAKAVLPLFETAMAERKIPNAAFFERYYQEVLRALGDRIFDPRLALQTSIFLSTDQSMDAFALRVSRKLSLSSMYTIQWRPDSAAENMASRYPRISVVIAGTPEDIRSMIDGLDAFGHKVPRLQHACMTENAYGGLGFLVPLSANELKAGFPSQFPWCRE